MDTQKIKAVKVSVNVDQNKNPYLHVAFTVSIADNDLTDVFTKGQIDAVEQYLVETNGQVKFAMDCLAAVLEYKKLTHSDAELADIAEEFSKTVFGK